MQCGLLRWSNTGTERRGEGVATTKTWLVRVCFGGLPYVVISKISAHLCREMADRLATG